MRTSICLKLAFLVPVVFATWFVTTSLTAQPSRKSEAVSDVIGQETAVLGVKNLPPGAIRRPEMTLYEYKMTAMDVTVVDQSVHVTATADMIDRRGDKTYLWRLQAIPSGAENAVLDVPYDQQLFTIDQSGAMSPTFQETIQLPVGSYQIFLSMYAVPHGYDLANLKDNTKAFEAMVMRNARPAVVE